MAEASVIMADGTLIVAVLAFPAATRASRLVTAWLVAIVTIGMAAPFALGGLGPDGSGCSSPGPSESVREGSPAISPDRGVSSSWWPGGPATSPFRSTSSSWWPGGPATNPDCGVSYRWQLLVVLVAIIGGLLLLWLTLIVALWIIQLTGPDELREALKLLPDLGHLLQRLAADAAVPQRVRIGLAVLIGYMLLPIDLVPDFIPA